MKQILLSAAFAALAAPAFSATIALSNFSAAAYNAALGGFGNAVSEDFESYSEGNVANGFATAVGSFSTVGGTGSGGTVTGADFANDGSLLALRDGDVYGRRSTTADLTGNAADDMFLDSNDTHGIRWDVSLGGSMFDKLLFTLTDATDVGAELQIFAGGMFQSISGLGNGATRIVEIAFDSAVSSARIDFLNYRGDQLMLNDGFSLDDVAVNDVSEVPLPASALLLLGGIGGLAAMRQRKG